MSYVLLLNPIILNKIGLPPKDIAIGTALSSALGTLLSGCLGNLPFGLAPGIGLSTYITYSLVLNGTLSITQAFTSAFIAGLLLWIFTITGISNIIMKIIPKGVKVGTIIGMGLQIAFVGMTSIDLIVSNRLTLVDLGDLYDYDIWLSIAGLLLIGTLLYHEIQGSILIGIITMTLITWSLESSWPQQWIMIPALQNPLSHYINFSELNFQCIPAILSFLFVGIVDLGGVIFGMASLAKLNDDNGNVPGAIYSFFGASAGTMMGAAMGSSPIIVYVESAAGIKEGGRTGFCAVIIASLFIVSVVFAPLFGDIPVTATAPVSMLVGVLMAGQATEINWSDMSEAIPAFLTLTLIPFSFSISNGILFGLITSSFFYISTGKLFIDIKKLADYANNNNRYTTMSK